MAQFLLPVTPPDTAVYSLSPLVIEITFICCGSNSSPGNGPSDCVRVRILITLTLTIFLQPLLCSSFGSLRAHRCWIRIQSIKLRRSR